MKMVNLFCLKITDESIEKIKKECKNFILKREKKFIITLNALILLNAIKNKSFMKVLKKADLIIADGAGILWCASKLGIKINNQVPGIDLMYALLGVAYENKFSVFLLGSKWKNVEAAYHNLKKWFPKARFLGRYHGYFKANEEKKVIMGINKVSPDFLFVGMGSPYQEKWIAQNIDKLNCKIIMGVGGSFDVFAGYAKRAPEWMRKKKLEWLYRSLTSYKRIINIFKLFYFVIVVYYYKIFRKKDIEQWKNMI